VHPVSSEVEMRDLLLLAFGVFAVQAGFHGFSAALPVALHRSGIGDAEVGLIVGIGSVAQVPAALVAGALIDRIGSRGAYLLGGLAYLGGALLIATPGLGLVVAALLIARSLQGLGSAATFSAALAHTPDLVEPTRRGLGLGIVSTTQALTVVLMPALSLVVLNAAGLTGVAWVMLVMIVVGIVLAVGPLSHRRDSAARDASDTVVAHRRLGIRFRRSWIPALAINVGFMLHWGVVLAFLPQRADTAGADIGLFFVANGLGGLISRIPAGWIADTVRPAASILVGLASTAAVIVLLTRPPDTTWLIPVAMVSAAAGGLVFTPTLVELSRRSTDQDRGSAFALYSASLASGLAVGSIGGAPFVERFGFEAAMLATIGGLAIAAAVTLGDRNLWLRPGRALAA
jgi:predicted MFS family arabinose efflux permease